MDLSIPSLERIGKTVGYLVLGIVGTTAVALALLYALQPIQPVVYEAFYLQVGPSEATETAILTHFLVASVVALGAAMLAGDGLSDRLRHRPALAKGIGAMVLLFVAFLVVSLAGLAAFLTALFVVAGTALAVPVLLRYRYGVRSGGVTAFVGGVPVVVVLLLLAGFGIGWGWGYVMTAQEVPASTVNESAAADFDDVPRIRDDLFAADCSTNTDDRRVCHLYLRGYEHEVRAARFMARHGIRCPYQNAQSGRSDSFVARDDGSYYRVACTPHGD